MKRTFDKQSARRRFLKMTGLAIGSIALDACNKIVPFVKLDKPRTATNFAVEYVPLGTDVTTLGVDNTGSQDTTQQIQAAVDQIAQLHFPAGTYLISKSIKLGDTNQIFGDGIDKTTFKWIGSTTIIEPDKYLYVFYADKGDSKISTIENVITSCTFLTPTAFSIYAFYGYATTNCSISFVKTINCGIAAMSQMGGFVVSNCQANGGEGRLVKGLDIVGLQGCSVENSSFENCIVAMQFWGGNSNPEKDDGPWRLTDKKQCTNITVVNCTGKNLGGLGKEDASALVFTSCCDNVRVTDCIVEDSLDVGIDFEGSNNCLAQRNTVRNCLNGGLTTFYCVDKIVFDGNLVFASTQVPNSEPPGLLYSTYGGQGSEGMIGSISILNNTFYAASNYFGRVTAKNGCKNMTISGNKFYDSGVQLLKYNVPDRTLGWNQIKVTGNVFHFSRLLGDIKEYLSNVIELGNTEPLDGITPTITVSDNQFNSDAPKSQSVHAVHIEQADSVSPVHQSLFENNTYSYNFPNQLELVWGGIVPGLIPTAVINGPAGQVQFTRDSKKYLLSTSSETETTNTIQPALFDQNITVNGVMQP